MDHSFDLFSIPDSPPISVYPILKWPGAETDRTAIPSHRLKFLVDGGNSPQPQEKYRMPFLSTTPVKSQAESRKTPSPSSSGESEDQKVGDWNPMKEDFMSTSFNSYDKGPGANLVGAGAPKQVLQASSSDKVSSEEPEMHQVYVRGIPKEMKEEALFNIFSKAGKVKEVSIKGASLFHTGQSGYGFVTFSSVKEVENAIRLIDGFRINNCALSVQPCAPRSERERRKSGKENLDGTPEKQRSGSLSSQGYDGRGTPRRDSNCSSDSSVDGHLKTPQSVSPGSLGRLSPGIKSPVGLGSPRNGMDSSSFGNSPSTTWNEKDEKADVSLGKVTVSGDVRRVILNHGSNSKEEPSPGVHHGTPGKQSPIQQSAKTDSPVSKKGKDGGCPRPCMYCKKAGVMFCSRCKGPYCSHECQKKHWPEHRAMCKPDLYKPKSDGTSPSAAKQLNMTEDESLVDHANHPQNTPKSSKQSVTCRKDHNYQAIPEDPAFEVLVTDVVSPDVVWCQIARESNVTALSSLMVLMNQFYSDPNTVTEDCIPQKGDIVAAQFSADGGWYRAEVKEINTDGHVHMHFVDFGNEEGMPKSRLRNLTKEMRDLPFQALKCCVAGIAPVNGQVGWSTDAVQVMKSKILNKKCLVQYEKQVADVRHLWICDPNDQHGSTVNDFMVKAQHAQKKTNNNSPQQSPPQPQQGKLQRQPVMVTDLPPKDVAKTGCFPVMCSYVENPGSFYVQIVDQDELKELSGIMEKMNGMCREIAYTPFQPKVGELVCAFYNTDNCWYRAVVKEVQQNQVLVQYADFGNSEVIPTSLLREYKDAKLPLQAIHCKLAGTIAVNEETGWSQSAKEFFCTLVEGKPLGAKLVETIDGKPLGAKLVETIDGKYDIELFDQENNQHIHQELIKQGFGKSAVTETNRDPSQPQTPLNFPLKLESEMIQLGTQMICNVTLVESPSELWIQVAKNAEAVIQLQEDLNVYFEKAELKAFSPKIGQVCAARFTADKTWYRAVVTQLGEPGPSNATVFYLDFGNSEVLDTANVQPLPDQFMKLAAQGIRCSLSGVKPVSSVWPKEATKFLKVAIESNLAEVQFVDKVDDLFNVKIFSLNDRKTSLNESMVEKGHAAPREDVAQPTSQKEVKKPIPQQSNNQQQDKVSHDQSLSNHQAAAAESVNIQNKTPSKQRHDEEDKKSNEALPKTPVTQQANIDPQVGSANQMVKLKNATIPDNESIPVCVTHVVNPNEFYVQQANEDTARALADLMTSINKHYLKASQTISQVQIGQLCCAKFSQDQAWYRAVVLDYAESKVKVQFVDFGNCEEVGLEDIQLLDKKFTSTPILAITCTLSGVTGTLEGGQWEDKTVQAFTEEILNRQCVVKAVGKVDDGVSEIELYGSSSEESLNQLLITAKLAVKKMPQVKDHTDGVVKEMLQVKGHKEETVKDVPEVKGHTDGAVKISQVKDDNENVIAVSEIQRIKVESAVKAAAIPTLQLPTNEECPVIVHDVVNPSEMYCQLATAENLLQVNALFEEMNSDPMSQQEDTVYKPDIGDLCSAQFTLDQSWCRAEVISIEDNVAVVRYVDFGNQEIVPLTAIKRLDEQFTLLPKQANKCAIAGIVPKDGSWSEDATAALKTLTGLGSKRLFGVVTGTCGDVTELELMDTATGEPVVISEKLVEDGYAAWKKAKAAKSDEVIPGGDNAASHGGVIHSDQTASPDASTPNDQVAGPGASAPSDKAVSPGPSTPIDQAASPDVSTQGESSLIECLLKENVNMKALMLEQQKQIQQMMQMLTELTTRKQ